MLGFAKGVLPNHTTCPHRRFKAAKDAQLSREAEEQVRKEVAERGLVPPPPRPPSWDYNVITPGTRFMENLSKALQWCAPVQCFPCFLSLSCTGGHMHVPCHHYDQKFFRALFRSNLSSTFACPLPLLHYVYTI